MINTDIKIQAFHIPNSKAGINIIIIHQVFAFIIFAIQKTIFYDYINLINNIFINQHHDQKVIT